MKDNVLKIRCTKRCQNYIDLWSPGDIKTVTGSAFCVSTDAFGSHGKYILTNSHLTDESVFIEITLPYAHASYSAKILVSLSELDVTVLTVDDENFWSHMYLFDLNHKRYPQSGTPVSLLGYPGGGYEPSMTNGIISRLTVKTVNHSLPQVLIQVDAAINKGNSGGPVILQSGDLVGIATGGISKSQNVSYVIPSQTIYNVLSDFIKSKDFLQCRDLGIETVAVHSPKKGLIITNSRHANLKKNDIIISINGDKGVVRDHVQFLQFMRNHDHREAVRLLIQRKELSIELRVSLEKIPIQYLTYDSDMIDKSYYVFAGLDFASINLRYFMPLHELYKLGNGRKISLYEKYKNLSRTKDDPQIVILKRIMPSEITRQYKVSQYRELILKKINDKIVHGLRDVYEACENVRSENIKFTFEQPDTGEKTVIIINHQEALLSCERIAKLYIQNHYHNM